MEKLIRGCEAVPLHYVPAPQSASNVPGGGNRDATSGPNPLR
jgi:hypothetical protein